MRASLSLRLLIGGVPVVLIAQQPPKLAPIGPAKVVWDSASESFPEPMGGENGDSVPIAWHIPLTNTSYLISATYRGTYASMGPSLACIPWSTAATVHTLA